MLCCLTTILCPNHCVLRDEWVLKLSCSSCRPSLHSASSPTEPPSRALTLRHGQIEASFLDYGARLISLILPDPAGSLADVVLGYESLALYLEDKSYFGAVVGRFANRIADGRFSLDGAIYTIPQNDQTNALHGGPLGFDRKLWTTKEVAVKEGEALDMTLLSPDGDQGFPGALTATVRYTLDSRGLQLDYTAATDRPTIVNLTNHAYFNLAGETSATILDHEITLAAAAFTPVTSLLVPTGELKPVVGTPFDLRSGVRIGDRIDEVDPQLSFAGGYDHNWVLGPPNQMKPAVILRDPLSGRTLTVSTTEPGVQFYSGNFLNSTMPNRVGGLYNRRSGLCLETQHFPDSPNHPNFPSTLLRPGETVSSTTLFSFETR